jgi:hypothetical protein
MLLNLLKGALRKSFATYDSNGNFQSIKGTPFVFISVVLAFLIYTVAVPDPDSLKEAYSLAISAIVSIAAPAGVAAINTIVNPSRRKKNK